MIKVWYLSEFLMGKKNEFEQVHFLLLQWTSIWNLYAIWKMIRLYFGELTGIIEAIK